MKQLLINEQHDGSHVRDEVSIVDHVDPVAWHRYLSTCEGNTLFHRREWDSIFALYKLPVVRLCAVREGAIVGGLPLVWQKSRLFGNQLVSLPWFDAAGILSDDSEVQELLVRSALEWAQVHQIDTVQIRSFTPYDVSRFGNVAVRSDKVLLRLSLPDDPVELWNRLRPKVRNQVRKGEKSGLVVEQGGQGLLSDFYSVYSRNMRDLGSPPHHRRFFDAILREFSNETRVWIVRLDQHVVGGAMTLANGNVLEIPWASSWKRFNDRCVNHLMYWKILEDACRSSFQAFHFGRSSVDSGTYHFKKQWGAEPIPLHWYFFSRKGIASPRLTSPQRSFHLASRAWRMLPVWLARALGPAIISKTP